MDDDEKAQKCLCKGMCHPRLGGVDLRHHSPFVLFNVSIIQVKTVRCLPFEYVRSVE